MRDLIKLDREKKIRLVDARLLHRKLGSKRRFADWIKSRLSSFDDGTDYYSFSQVCEKPNGGRPSVEYGLTIDMAKHICMLEKNEVGKKIRQYFIDIENKYAYKESRIKSAKSRNLLTDAWCDCGITKPYEFINLTRAGKCAVGIDKKLKKDNMDKEQIATITALESLEYLKLIHNTVEGYYECKDSIIDTGEIVKKVRQDKRQEIGG